MNGIARLLLTPLLIVTVLMSAARAADPVKEISTVDHFAFGGVGVAGTTSKGEQEFREVLKRRSAVADFQRLLSTGNTQAKCYALAGLRELEPEAYAAAVKRYRKSDATVAIAAGCMIGSATVSDIVKRLEAGHYDPWLRKPRR